MKRSYATREALLAACPQPAGTRLIEVSDKTYLFGDPTHPDFEKNNIVTV